METKLISATKLFIVLLVLVTTVSSCRFGYDDPFPIDQSNNIIEERIPLNNFNRIEMGNSFRVFVRKGANFSIIAKGDQYDIQDLEAAVNSGKLRIKYRNNANRRYEMIFYITMPTLTEANFSGVTIAEITNFNENKITINASGASDVFVDSDAKIWDIDLSGASILEMLGQGHSMILDASGASELRANNLYMDNVDLNISGSSTVRVYAYDEIIGKASGSSGIRFKGNPYVNIKLSGGAWVEKN
jgi:Putative auto-transporter adhesin, head GIN domain